MTSLRLDFRPTFRRFAKEEQEAFAKAIRAARPKKEKDRKPTGGNLARDVKAAKVRRVKRWGFVIRYHLLSQKLTWFVRGKKNQAPRPIKRPETDTDALTAELERQAKAKVAQADKRARP